MTGTQNEIGVRVVRRSAATRDRVFDAWTNPEVLRQWWAAQPSWETPTAEVDLRPGERYRLSMRTESGDIHTVAGEYTEVRPEHLAYTWCWESGPSELEGSPATLVVVDFKEDGDSTEIVVTHSGFANAEIGTQHEHGWNAVLENLARQVFGDGAAG